MKPIESTSTDAVKLPLDCGEGDVFGCLAQAIGILGDIEAPLIEPESWEVD